MNIYILNAVVSLTTLFLLCVAIGYDRRHIRPAWRGVLMMGALEQAVLAYGSLEARRSNVAIEYRQKLLALTLMGLLLSVVVVIVLTLMERRGYHITLSWPRRKR